MLPEVRFSVVKPRAPKLIVVPSGASVMGPVLPEPSDRVVATSRPRDPAGIESVSAVAAVLVTSRARPTVNGCSRIVPPGTEMTLESLGRRVSVSVVNEMVRPAGAVTLGPPVPNTVSGTADTTVMLPMPAASVKEVVANAAILFSGLSSNRDPTAPTTLLVVITLPDPCVTGPAGTLNVSPLGAFRPPSTETPPTPALSVMPPVTSSVTPGSTRTRLPPSSVSDWFLPVSVTEEDATTLLVAWTVTSPMVACSVAGVMTVPGPPWSLMLISAGSISTRPTWPAGAPVLIRPVIVSV